MLISFYEPLLWTKSDEGIYLKTMETSIWLQFISELFDQDKIWYSRVI